MGTGTKGKREYVCVFTCDSAIYLFLLTNIERTTLSRQSELRNCIKLIIRISNTGHKTPKCTLKEAFVSVVKQNPNITQMNNIVYRM